VILTRSVSSPGAIGIEVAIAGGAAAVARIATEGAKPGSSVTQANFTKPQLRGVCVDFGLAPRVGHCRCASLIERL